MIKGLQTACAVVLLLIVSGVTNTATAQVNLLHKYASNTSLVKTCILPLHGLVAELKQPKLLAKVSSTKPSKSPYIKAVFATANTQNGYFDASITGEKEDNIEPTPTASIVPEQKTDVVLAQAAPTPSDGSLNADVLFNMINTHRQNIGLPALQKDGNLCAIAQSRGPELYNEIFVTYNMHAGFYARNLPYWATENMIHQDTEQAAFNWWMNSSVHRGAIEGNYTHACGACQGKSCAMIFTSFVPK